MSGFDVSEHYCHCSVTLDQLSVLLPPPFFLEARNLWRLCGKRHRHGWRILELICWKGGWLEAGSIELQKYVVWWLVIPPLGMSWWQWSSPELAVGRRRRNRCCLLLVDLKLGLQAVLDTLVLLVLFVLQCWQSMLLLQATEIQTGDQGLNSAWWNGWNVLTGSWAAQPHSVPKLWEGLAASILDRKLLGVPKEEHMWASECGGVSVYM